MSNAGVLKAVEFAAVFTGGGLVYGGIVFLGRGGRQ